MQRQHLCAAETTSLEAAYLRAEPGIEVAVAKVLAARVTLSIVVAT